MVLGLMVRRETKQELILNGCAENEITPFNVKEQNF